MGVKNVTDGPTDGQGVSRSRIMVKIWYFSWPKHLIKSEGIKRVLHCSALDLLFFLSYHTNVLISIGLEKSFWGFVCRKHMRAPGSTQCFTSCRFLVDNKLGSCTLFLCFNNLPLRCNFCHLGHSSHFHITKPCKDFPSAAKQSQCSRQYNGAKNDQRTSLG